MLYRRAGEDQLSPRRKFTPCPRRSGGYIERLEEHKQVNIVKPPLAGRASASACRDPRPYNPRAAAASTDRDPRDPSVRGPSSCSRAADQAGHHARQRARTVIDMARMETGCRSWSGTRRGRQGQGNDPDGGSKPAAIAMACSAPPCARKFPPNRSRRASPALLPPACKWSMAPMAPPSTKMSRPLQRQGGRRCEPTTAANSEHQRLKPRKPVAQPIRKGKGTARIRKLLIV